ncbi:MAG: DUF2934 domain-containing protein [Bryobacteraceae bacterium]
MAGTKNQWRPAFPEGTAHTAVEPPTTVEPETTATSQTLDCNSESARDEIARIAYSYWEARGCPEGSQEEDWLLAEQEYRQRS